MLVAPLVASALGLMISAPLRASLAPTQRSPLIFLCTPGPGDVQLREAARRVVAAAEAFGSTQAEVATTWVNQVMMEDGVPMDSAQLLETQLSLFDECLISDEDGAVKCKELDAALGELEGHLMAAASATPAEQFFSIFGTSKLDRAAARVRSAANKFGPEEGKAAEDWIVQVREQGAADPAGLLESQMALFGECLLDEGGTSARCQELEESLQALQVSLGIRGMIVSTRDLIPEHASQE